MTPDPTTPPGSRNVLPDLRSTLVRTAHERAALTASVPSRRRHQPWIVRGVAGTTALFIVLLLITGSHRGPEAGVPDQGPSGAATTARSEFAVFRNAAATTGQAAVPEGSLFRKGDMAPDFTIDLTEARRLAVPGRDVWVAPAVQRGRSMMCLRLRDATGVLGTCARLESVASTGIWASSRTAPDDPAGDRSERVGLVPDGVARVTFHLVDGSTTTTAVTDNAVVHGSSFATRARSVTFIDAAGKRQRVGF